MNTCNRCRIMIHIIYNKAIAVSHHHSQKNQISQINKTYQSDQNNYGKKIFIGSGSGVSGHNGNNDDMSWFGGGVDRHKLGEANISTFNPINGGGSIITERY